MKVLPSSVPTNSTTTVSSPPGYLERCLDDLIGVLYRRGFLCFIVGHPKILDQSLKCEVVKVVWDTNVSDRDKSQPPVDGVISFRSKTSWTCFPMVYVSVGQT